MFNFRRSNHSESCSFLVQVGAVITLTLLKDFPTLSSIILLLSVIFTFMLETISQDFICEQHYRYERTSCMISVWFVLYMAMTIVSQEKKQ